MGNINTEYQSELNLKNIFVSFSEFRRKEILKPQLKMSFLFDHDLIISDEDNFKIILTGTVKSEDDSVFANASVTGFFGFKSDAVDKNMRDFLRANNAVTIMFPYLRTQIALISSQSGVNLNVPAININAYFDNKKKKEEQKQAKTKKGD